MKDSWTGVVLSIVAAVATLILGICGLRALREMLRSGHSYTIHDWRRVIGRATAYDRTDQPALFWTTIFLNAFLITIALSISIGIFLMIAITIVAIIFGPGLNP